MNSVNSIQLKDALFTPKGKLNVFEINIFQAS